jgi:hypothetical protein
MDPDDLLGEGAKSMSAEIDPTEQNAPAATKAGFETRPKHNHKRLPPYGRQLMAIREAGKVPIKMVVACFDWNQARAYPRIIILPAAAPESLDLRFLAGIPVEIVYKNEDAHRVDALVQEIMQVNPCYLATLGLDLLDTDNARNIIRPQLFDYRMGGAKLWVP